MSLPAGATPGIDPSLRYGEYWRRVTFSVDTDIPDRRVQAELVPKALQRGFDALEREGVVHLGICPHATLIARRNGRPGKECYHCGVVMREEDIGKLAVIDPEAVAVPEGKKRYVAHFRCTRRELIKRTMDIPDEMVPWMMARGAKLLD